MEIYKTLYKGFIETKGKVSKEKIKGRTHFKSLSDVEHSESFAGMLKDDIVLVDFDDERHAAKILDILDSEGVFCYGIKTTRGIHLLFKRGELSCSQSHVTLACGLVADIKTGDKNQYEVIKLDGKLRPEVWEDTPRIDTLPKWLHPIKGGKNLLDMADGDGRNSTLYAYILSLQNAGFSAEEIKETYRIINTHVLKDPLDMPEMESILRDEAFQKCKFYARNKFLHQQAAEHLMKEFHVKLIEHQPCIYVDGHYRADMMAIKQAVYSLDSRISSREVSEVIAYLMANAPKCAQADKKFICFKNGILNIETGELSDFSHDVVILNKIPVAYKPNAVHELTERTIRKIANFDEDIERTLYEIVGYSFLRASDIPVTVFLLGSGANGKSTFLKVLKTILGAQNVSTLDLHQLSERFSTAELFCKLANIGDDITSERLPNRAASMLKRISSSNPIKAERKGGQPFSFEPYATLVCSANEMPTIEDSSHGLMRRMLPVPFLAKFSPEDEDYDVDISAKLTTDEALEFMVARSVEALKGLLARKCFAFTDTQRELLRDIERTANPLLDFFELYSKEEVIGLKTAEFYTFYTEWAISEGFKPCAQQWFSRMTCNYYQVALEQVRSGNKRHRVFK